MFDSRPLIVFIVLATLLFGSAGGKEHSRVARHDSNSESDSHEECTDIPWIVFWLPSCPTTERPSMSTRRTTSTTSASTDTAATSKSSTTSEKIDSSTTSKSSTSTEKTNSTSASVLENAFWCQLKNGTYLPRNYTYFQSVCSYCRCTDSKVIRCSFVQCLPAYCVDDSMPNRKEGQCCAQCSYEEGGKSCLYDGINYPHGAIVKYSEPSLQCWCQMGNIECRSNIASLLQGFEVLTEGVTLYIILFVLFSVFFFGLMICCSCTGIFYYYYQKHQASFQQVYDEYMNEAGWQAIDEAQEYPVDGVVEEKQFEAEKSAVVDEGRRESVPPPYSTIKSS